MCAFMQVSVFNFKEGGCFWVLSIFFLHVLGRRNFYTFWDDEDFIPLRSTAPGIVSTYCKYFSSYKNICLLSRIIVVRRVVRFLPRE